MKHRKIYIFGAGGMLGNYLVSYFDSCGLYSQVVGLGRREFEIDQIGLEELYTFFAELGIDQNSIVINAIGIVPQAALSPEHFSTEAYLTVNGVFPHYLAFACSKVGAHMFQVSTDCVFSGRRDAQTGASPYLENSKCDEVNAYGISKAMGEPMADSCSVLRSSLIGQERKHSRSLLQWVLDEASRSSSIDGYRNHFWNGITCLQLALMLHHIIENELFWRGVRHFFSPDRISKFELLSIIVEEFGLDCTVKPYFKEGVIDKSLGSLYSLNQEMAIPTIREQIRALRKFELPNVL